MWPHKNFQSIKRLTPLLAMLYLQPVNAAWIETGAEVESRPGVKTMYVVSADKGITDPKAVKHMVLLLTGAAGVIPPAVNGSREQKPDRVALRGYFAEKARCAGRGRVAERSA